MTIKTTFNIGDTVWVMRNNRAVSGVIDNIVIRSTKSFDGALTTNTYIVYTVKFTDDYHPEGFWYEYREGTLFETKEALIATL